jgi:hypothetical protein
VGNISVHWLVLPPRRSTRNYIKNSVCHWDQYCHSNDCRYYHWRLVPSPIRKILPSGAALRRHPAVNTQKNTKKVTWMKPVAGTSYLTPQGTMKTRSLPKKTWVSRSGLGSVAPQICSYCEWRGKCDISLIVGRWRHYRRGQQLASGGPSGWWERHTHDMIFKIDQRHFLGPPCRSVECWKLHDEWIGKAIWDLQFFFSSCMKKRLIRSKSTFMGLHLAYMMKIIMQMIFLL